MLERTHRYRPAAVAIVANIGGSACIDCDTTRTTERTEGTNTDVEDNDFIVGGL